MVTQGQAQHFTVASFKQGFHVLNTKRLAPMECHDMASITLKLRQQIILTLRILSNLSSRYIFYKFQ